MSFSPLKNFHTHQLPNGLRILFKEDHAWPLTSVHAWVHVGSVDESTRQAGISHVIEHMVFKGTERYKPADISRWVESLGGAMNAETSKEYTHYYIDVPSAGGQKAVSLLGELLHRAMFQPKEWDRERPVILEEIKRRNDDPEALLWDLLNEALFQEERLRRPVIGSPETVEAISRDELWRYYREFYRAGRTLVVVVGDFKPRTLMKWIQSAFGDMPEGPGPLRTVSHNGASNAQHLTLQKPVQQVYFALGFPTPSSTHPDHEALDLLATVLGDGRSSRLVRTLREEKRMVWSVNATNYGQEGPGVFSIFAECSPAHRSRLRSAVEQILQSLWRRRPSHAELARAKNLIHNGWLQSFETYHQQASTVGLYALDEQLERLQQYLPRLMALTSAQIEQVIHHYLTLQPLSTAVIEA